MNVVTYEQHVAQQLQSVGDVETQIRRAKNFASRLSRGMKAAKTLSEKLKMHEHVKSAERTVRQLRTSIS